MSTALEGAPKRGITLTEQANGQRIGRSMFIGHTVGYLFLVLLAWIAIALVGLGTPVLYKDVFGTGLDKFVPPEGVFLMVPAPWPRLVLWVVAALVWTDLTVRRRRDRGRSGVDAMTFQILLLASVIIHAFANAPDIVVWLDGALVLYGLYLFVVLVILPGDPKENRYGAVPRPD